MNDLILFNNPEFGDIRTVMIDGEPWFVGRDVAKALGYSKPEGAIKNNVDEGDTLRQGVSDANNHTQQMIIVNESGLYSLIFGSKLESAKKFKKWVTSEVLPQLRKTGSYGLTLTTDQQIQLLAKGQVEVAKRLDKNENDIKEVKDDLEELKLDLPLFPVEAEIITKTARRRGTEILGGKQSKAYKRVSIRNTVYRNLYIDINRNFNVRSYKAIKRRDCERAASLIEKWTPPLYIEDKIKEANA